MRILLLICLLVPIMLQAQEETNDPKATLLLDKLSSELERTADLTATFQLKIELPEMEPEIQAGKFVQKGDTYTMDAEGQSIVNDGKSVYIMLHDQKIVQIYDAAELGSQIGGMSPKSIIDVYKSGDFIYALTGKEQTGAKVANVITFKPKDRRHEYSKIEILLDTKKNHPLSMKVFSKDGSRFTLAIQELEINKSITEPIQFDNTKYSKYAVEDLRI